MQETRLYKTLKQLDIPQLSRFNKFMESPYFNVNNNQKRLLIFLTKYIKSKEAVPSKETCWHSYNEENVPFDDLKFRKLCSDIISKFETFLIHEHVKSDGLLEKNMLLEQIQTNGFELILNKAVDNSDKYFDRYPEKSANYHLRLYKKGQIKYDISDAFDKEKNKKTQDKLLMLDNLSHNLDQYYVIEKLKLACTLVSWQRIYKVQNKPFEVEVILRLLNRNELLKNPAIAVYRNMYLMLTEKESIQYYNQLKILVNNHFDIFDKVEQRSIYDAMISYCIGWVNQGDKGFMEESLDVYDVGIDNGIILQNDELSPTTFRNYVLIGLRLNKFDQIEQFINEKSALLSDKLRENALNFNLARVSFYKKDFESVISYLARVDYEDVLYNLNSRALSLAVNYELKEWDVLESQLDSFSTYLNRQDKLSDARKMIYVTFIKFLKKIVNSTFDKKEKLEEVKSEIEKEKQVINKSWLIEKIDELL